MVDHAGNGINQIAFEEHDHTNYAKRVNVVAGGVGLATVNIASAATIFAVVNTGAAGIATVVSGAGDRFIGLVTNVQAGLTTLAPSPNLIGLVTIAGMSTVTLADSKGYIGLVTIGGIGTLTLADPKGFIGLVTIGGMSLVTLGDSKGYIGLVTATIGNASVVTKNGGTTKTLQIFPVTISTGSAATIYVPTNTFKMTSLLLNSNATVRVNVRSGATYLTGNASIGIELNPGSGFVERGSPDSPIYFGLVAGSTAPIVIEKTDYSGVISRVSGKLVLFDE